MEYLLCSYCYKRHGENPYSKKAKNKADCFICQGIIANYKKLADTALSCQIANKAEWETFSIQSTFPRKAMVREEELLDNEPLELSQTIKNQANRLLSDYVCKKTGKQHSPANPDLVIRADFWHNSACAIPSSIFIFSRYLKLSRNYCQHQWKCKKCAGRGCKNCGGAGEKYPSIEGAISEAFQPAFKASQVLLHASGREDVDVITKGTGRPCVIEIKRPLLRKVDLPLLAKKIANSHPIQLKAMKFVPPFWVEVVCTSHFEKTYELDVEFEKKASRQALASLERKTPLLLCQRTPTRVSKRRADKVRKRKVLSFVVAEFSPTTAKIMIRADAGTYIKEFVHGDNGRTIPSLSSLLGTNAKCKQLNVIAIHDEFISTLKC